MGKFSSILKKLSDSIFEEVDVLEEVDDDDEGVHSFENDVKEETVVTTAPVKTDEVKPKVLLDVDEEVHHIDEVLVKKEIKEEQDLFDRMAKSKSMNSKYKYQSSKPISPVKGVLLDEVELEESKKVVTPTRKKEVKSKGVFRTVTSPIFGSNIPSTDKIEEEKEVIKPKNLETEFSLDEILSKKDDSLSIKEVIQVDANFESLVQTEADHHDEYENLSLFDIDNEL